MTRPLRVVPGREHTGDRQTDELWRQIGALAALVNASPFLSGRLITEEDDGVPFSGLRFTGGTPRAIAHRLGRRSRGFIEVYGTDVPSSNAVRLRAVEHINGVTSLTHITVHPLSTGACWIWVF